MHIVNSKILEISRLLSPQANPELNENDYNSFNHLLWEVVISLAFFTDEDEITPKLLLDLAEEGMTNNKNNNTTHSIKTLALRFKEYVEKLPEQESFTSEHRQNITEQYDVLVPFLNEILPQAPLPVRIEIKRIFHESVSNLLKDPLYKYLIFDQGTIEPESMTSQPRLEQPVSINKFFALIVKLFQKAPYLPSAEITLWDNLKDFNLYHPELVEGVSREIRNRIGFIPQLDIRAKYERRLRTLLLDKNGQHEFENIVRQMRNEHIERISHTTQDFLADYRTRATQEDRDEARAYLSRLLGQAPSPECGETAECLIFMHGLHLIDKEPFPIVPVWLLHVTISLYHYHAAMNKDGIEAARNTPFIGFKPRLGVWILEGI